MSVSATRSAFLNVPQTPGHSLTYSYEMEEVVVVIMLVLSKRAGREEEEWKQERAKEAIHRYRDGLWMFS